MRIIQLSLLIIFSLTLSAQMGIELGYQQPLTDPPLSNSIGEHTTYDNWGYRVGFDYWYRLKKKRIEFSPGVAYSYSSYQPSTSLAFPMEHHSFLIEPEVQFYLIDLLEDCNCPTFTKNADMFKKGFFLDLQPAIAYRITKVDDPSIPSEERKTKYIGLRIGAGPGFDFGISRFLTITPIIRAVYEIPLRWRWMGDGYASYNGFSVEFAVRFGMRFDYRYF